ncbi:MAG: pseudouridine-5'-phosphate glycosidase [Saprospiraceae bacterium]|nr:pseudouridine-5'-phosphate glycosidase [Saprospiraceae bacterium]
MNIKIHLPTSLPPVALESTLLCHGLPWPANYELALEINAVLAEEGAAPAVVALIDGQVRVGLDTRELETLCREGSKAVKVATRDIPYALATRQLGATTVSATMWAAAKTGIRLFATGGIGGVHRDGENSLDISADLVELSRTPVAVVSAGAKSILDLGRTLEYLETMGVPVVGYGTNTFPAFYVPHTPYDLPCRVDHPEMIAGMLYEQDQLGLSSGMLIANPIPASHAISAVSMETWIEEALAAAATEHITGKAVTPFLLAYLHRISKGKTVEANKVLVLHNVRLAAQIAKHYATLH